MIVVMRVVSCRVVSCYVEHTLYLSFSFIRSFNSRLVDDSLETDLFVFDERKRRKRWWWRHDDETKTRERRNRENEQKKAKVCVRTIAIARIVSRLRLDSYSL